MITFFNYLLISNTFLGGFILFRGYFDFYLGYVFMICFLFFCIYSYRKLYVSKSFIFILLFMSLLSFLNVFLGNDSVPCLLKIFLGFIFNGVVYYMLFRLNNNEVDKLFRIYLQIACVVALIGIFQEISYLAGFEGGYDYRSFISRTVPPNVQSGILRVTSIMQEPSHFGNAMAPAMFVSILNIIRKKGHFISKKMSCLIIISVLLSFSLVAYIGIAIAFILIMLNYRRVILICTSAIILFVSALVSYRYLPAIKMRVDQTVAVINGNIPLETANLSTFSFCSNGLVALRSFMNNPLFGAGLGSHPLSFDKYLPQTVNQDLISLSLNREDACSLFFRLISETGLLGVFLFFYFILRFYVSKGRDEYYWIISNSIACLFVLNLLRQGNYFYCNFIFFIWAYYFTSKNISESNTITCLKKVQRSD